MHTKFCVVQIHYYEMFHANAMKLLHLPATNSVVGPGHRFVFAIWNAAVCVGMNWTCTLLLHFCTTIFVAWYWDISYCLWRNPWNVTFSNILQSWNAAIFWIITISAIIHCYKKAASRHRNVSWAKIVRVLRDRYDWGWRNWPSWTVNFLLP